MKTSKEGHHHEHNKQNSQYYEILLKSCNNDHHKAHQAILNSRVKTDFSIVDLREIKRWQ